MSNNPINIEEIGRAGPSGEEEERVRRPDERGLSMEESLIDGVEGSLGFNLAAETLGFNARADVSSSELIYTTRTHSETRQEGLEIRERKLTWLLLDGSEKAYALIPIYWDDGMTSVPPRRAKVGDQVGEDLPMGWDYIPGGVEAPNCDRFALSSTRRLLPLGSPNELEYIGRQPFKHRPPVWEPAGHMEEDGMHYGSASAVIPPGMLMDSRDLYAGESGGSDLAVTDYIVDSVSLPDEALVSLQPLVAGGTDVDVDLEVLGSYMVQGLDGNRTEVTCQPAVQVAALRGALLTEHTSTGHAHGIQVSVEADAALAAYIDSSTPLGDTRGLTGLSEVINVVGRGALLGNIRSWFADGDRHSGSYLGYTKLWLYVISLMIRDQIDADFAGTTWAFANDPAVVQPNWENSTVDRRCWDAFNAQVRDRSRGWFVADPGTNWQVAQCMADFYRPFPSFILTMQNHRINATPAPLGHSFPGIHLTMCTGKDDFGILGPAGGVAAAAGVAAPPQTLPARATVPTIAQYYQAIRQMAFWRDEFDDCKIGLSLALRMSACHLRNEIVPADATTRRWPVWANGIVGSGTMVEMPITNTLVSAYVKGSVTARGDLEPIFNLPRDWILRTMHKLTVAGIDASSRTYQALCVSSGDIDDVILNVDTIATDVTSSMWGTRRQSAAHFWQGTVKYLRRVYGIMNCRDVNRVLYNRRRWQTGFSMARIVARGELALFMPAWACLMYRHAPRAPWQWEILVAGCTYGGAEVHRLGAAQRRVADYVHTNLSQTRVDRTGKFAAVDQYIEALVLTQHASELEGGRAALNYRSRHSESEKVATLSPFTTLIANAWVTDAGHQGTYLLSTWHVNFDSTLLRAVRYEVSRTDHGPLSRATIAHEQRPLATPGVLLSAALPSTDVVHPGAPLFAGWEAAPSVDALGHVAVEVAGPVVAGAEENRSADSRD